MAVKPLAFLFDLDGTLVDTAPDLGHAANQVRADDGLPALPMSAYRPVASAGARGLLKVALDLAPEHPRYPSRRDRFLQVYRDNLSRGSHLFPGMEEILAGFQHRGLPWGVVTNKPEWLALPLLQALGLAARAACAIGARDGVPVKPAPDGLLLACRQLKLAPPDCVYVGDDRRDVEAARAADMPVLAAAWGYIGATERIGDWGADAVLETPADLARYAD